MGWFSSKHEDESNPTRENRQKCWEARDAYFACLDLTGIVKPPGQLSNRQTPCAGEMKIYERDCAKSWIDYFNQRRIMAEAQKERLGQGKVNSREQKE